jgi:hypothetical protein
MLRYQTISFYLYTNCSLYSKIFYSKSVLCQNLCLEERSVIIYSLNSAIKYVRCNLLIFKKKRMEILQMKLPGRRKYQTWPIIKGFSESQMDTKVCYEFKNNSFVPVKFSHVTIYSPITVMYLSTC